MCIRDRVETGLYLSSELNTANEHVGFKCNKSYMEPIVGNRYSNGEYVHLCEEEYLKLSEEEKVPYRKVPPPKYRGVKDGKYRGVEGKYGPVSIAFPSAAALSHGFQPSWHDWKWSTAHASNGAA